MSSTARHFFSPDIRREEIRRRLNAGEKLEATNLSSEFEVSRDTIRRDFIALEKMGAASRVRGGVVPYSLPFKPLRDRHHLAQKQRSQIAFWAANAIGESDTVFLDGGTTAVGVVQEISATFKGQLVTPNPLAAVWAHKRDIGCILLGGALSRNGAMAKGIETVRSIEGMRANCAIISPCAVDPQSGIWADDHDEAIVKRAMLRSARNRIVMVQAYKVGQIASHLIDNQFDGYNVVTDAPTDVANSLRDTGATVSVVH